MIILLLFYITIFLFGLTVGSFLNCVIYRLEKKESFLKGRSYCPSCRHKLSWQDLIPLLSFIDLKGKCRYCKKAISIQYPLVELATGILFVSVFRITFPIFLFFIFYFLISSLLIVIFVYDLKYYIIPDEVIYSAVGVTLIYNILYSYFILHNSFLLFHAIYSALGASLFFLVIFLISKGRWLGFGDVKLALFMGLFLGFPNILVALFFSFFIGAIIGLGLIVLKKKTLKSQVPFGPFLVTGTFIALFWGEKVIQWYFGLFKI